MAFATPEAAHETEGKLSQAVPASTCADPCPHFQVLDGDQISCRAVDVSTTRPATGRFVRNTHEENISRDPRSKLVVA